MSHTDSYLSFFTAVANYAPMSMLTLFILGAMRLAPIVSMAPFFGGKTPAPIKMGLLIVLTTIFLPHIALTAQTLTGFNIDFMFLCLKELFIGFILAFLVSVPFYMAQSAGVTIDFLRGSSALQVNDPTMQSQTSPIGQLYNFVLIVIFYQIDGPFYFFNAIFDTYTIIPADSWLPIAFFFFSSPPMGINLDVPQCYHGSGHSACSAVFTCYFDDRDVLRHCQSPSTSSPDCLFRDVSKIPCRPRHSLGCLVFYPATDAKTSRHLARRIEQNHLHTEPIKSTSLIERCKKILWILNKSCTRSNMTRVLFFDCD